MPEVLRLCGYWRQHPPLHVLLAGMLGYKPAPAAHAITAEESGKLAAWLGAPAAPPPHVRELMNWTEAQKDKLHRR